MAYEEIEIGIWNYEKKGEFIEGFLLEAKSDVGTNKSMLYTLDVDKKPLGVWGSTVLDPKMLGVKVGDKVKIVYDGLGEAKGGRSAPKLFKVFVDVPEEEKPVETVKV